MIGWLVLIVALLLTNFYWYQRERALRRGLAVCNKWDSSLADIETKQRDTDRYLEDIAATLNTSISDVPEAVESLDAKVRELTRSLKKTRRAWGISVADALAASKQPRSGPLIVHLLKGRSEDVHALATATEREGLTAVCGHEDATFVVTTTADSTESAAEIASDAIADYPGGAGGSDALAQGGGSDKACFDGIEAAFSDRTEGDPRIIFLGGD